VQMLRQIVRAHQVAAGVAVSGCVLSLPLGGDTFNVGRPYIGRPARSTPGNPPMPLILLPPPTTPHAEYPARCRRGLQIKTLSRSRRVVIVNDSNGALPLAR